MSTRVLFGGMVSSGKSTLVCSLYRLLGTWGVDVSLHEIDVWSDTHACILGEKPWDQRNNTKDNSPEMHRRFQAKVEEFRSDSADLVLGDMPGREANESFPLLPRRFAECGVLVTRSPLPKDTHPFLASSPEGWRRIMERTWLIPVCAEVLSVRNGDQPTLEQYGIDGLEREPQPHHPEIERLAEFLLEHADSHRMVAA